MDQKSCNCVPVHNVVFLVHGTFAAGTSWPKMQDDIARALPDVAFFPFPWSGRNSMLDRATATERLRKELRWHAERFPEAKLHIIGHSHGGNVAAQAVSTDVLPRIGSVITLSTPFYVTEERSNRDAWFMFISLALITGVLLVGGQLVGVRALRATAGMRVLRDWMDAGVVQSIIAVWLFMAVLYGPAFWGIVRLIHWRRKGKERTAILDRPLLSDLPLMILRSPADEASLGLVTIQALSYIADTVIAFASWITERCLVLLKSAPDTLTSRLPERFRPWAGMAILQSLAVPVYVFLFTGWPAGPEILLAVPAFTYLAMFALVLLAALVAAPFAFLLCIGTLFYGGFGMAVTALERRVAIEPAPPGQYTMIQLPTVGARVKGLRHSSHSDPLAIEAIVTWLRAKAEPLRAPAKVPDRG